MTDDKKNIIPEGNGLQDETTERTTNGAQPNGIGVGEIPAADTSGTGSDAAADTSDAAQDAGQDRNALQAIEQDETRRAIIAAAASLAGMSPGEEIDGKTAARFFAESTPESRAAWMKQAPEAGKRLKEAAENVRAMVLYELTNPDKERAAAVVDAAMNIMLIYSREMSGRLALALTPEFSGMADYFFSEDGEEAHRAARAASAAAVVWHEVRHEMPELKPYLEAEARDGYGLDLDALLDTAEIGPDGNLLQNCIFSMVLTAARAARAAEEEREQLPRVTAKRADFVTYPIDKINNKVWRFLEEGNTDGQIAFDMASWKDKRGKNKKEIPIYYAINFDELGDDVKITKKLTPFDRRVYMAVSALFNTGNDTFSASEVHEAMGSSGRPSKKQVAKINDSITKMNNAKIFIDNKAETEHYKYALFRYDGHLLPMERTRAYINGRLVESAIHLFREPPLMTFARQRKQVTTLNIRLLQSPLSKTDKTIPIEDYLIEAISKDKNKKRKRCRIRLETLYEYAGITTPKQKERAPDKIKTYLAHYQKEGFITKFEIDRDGITIFLA